MQAPRAQRATQRRAAANGRTCLRAARSAGHCRRLPLDAPRRFREHSRVQMHTRALLVRHRYPSPYQWAHCLVRLRWTSLSLVERHIRCIRACEDARSGVSSGELSGREGSTFFFFFRVGAHGRVSFSVYSFLTPSTRLKTLMD